MNFDQGPEVPKISNESAENIPLSNIDCFKLLNDFESLNNYISTGINANQILFNQFSYINTRDAISTTEKIDRSIKEAHIKADNLINQIKPIAPKIGFVFRQKEADKNQDSLIIIPEYELKLSNGKNYVEYLQALEASQITSSQKNGLIRILNKILSDMEKSDLSDVNNDVFMTLVLNGQKITEEYERLGLKDEVYRLKEYLDCIKNNTIKERILAHNNFLDLNLDESEKKFIWLYNDADLIHLNIKIISVMETLLKIYENPKAIEIYETAKKIFENALAIALKKYEEIALHDKWYNGHLLLIKNYLREIKNQF